MKPIIIGYNTEEERHGADFVTTAGRILFSNVIIRTYGNVRNTNLEGNLIAPETYVEGNFYVNSNAHMYGNLHSNVAFIHDLESSNIHVSNLYAGNIQSTNAEVMTLDVTSHIDIGGSANIVGNLYVSNIYCSSNTLYINSNVGIDNYYIVSNTIPSTASHLTNKQYVDDQVSVLRSNILTGTNSWTSINYYVGGEVRYRNVGVNIDNGTVNKYIQINPNITYTNNTTNEGYVFDGQNTTGDLIVRNYSSLALSNPLKVSDIKPVGNTITLGGDTSTATVNVGTSDTTQTINIGTGTGITTINIGGSGDIVNINGNVQYTTVYDLAISDKDIILNAGSVGSGTARGSGIYIRDNSSNVAGKLVVNSAGTGFNLKAPEDSREVNFDLANFGNGLLKVSGNVISASVGTISDISGLQTSLNSKANIAGQTFTGAIIMNTDVSTPEQLRLTQRSGNLSVFMSFLNSTGTTGYGYIGLEGSDGEGVAGGSPNQLTIFAPENNNIGFYTTGTPFSPIMKLFSNSAVVYGNLSVSNYNITNVANPKVSGDAVNLGYINDHFTTNSYVSSQLSQKANLAGDNQLTGNLELINSGADSRIILYNGLTTNPNTSSTYALTFSQDTNACRIQSSASRPLILNQLGNDVQFPSSPIIGNSIANKTYVDSREAVFRSNLLANNNTWTGTNQFNNEVRVIDTSVIVRNATTTKYIQVFQDTVYTNNTSGTGYTIDGQSNTGDLIVQNYSSLRVNNALKVNDIKPVSSTLTIGGDNGLSTLNLATSDSTQTINIGTGTGITTINIGQPTDIINLNGNVQYTQVQDLAVTNKDILLNANAVGSGTARGAGIVIRDNSSDTAGKFIVNNAGTGYNLKAPEEAREINLDLSSFADGVLRVSGNTVTSGNVLISNVTGLQSSLDGKLNLSGGTMTGSLTLNASNPIIVTTDNAILLPRRQTGSNPQFITFQNSDGGEAYGVVESAGSGGSSAFGTTGSYDFNIGSYNSGGDVNIYRQGTVDGIKMKFSSGNTRSYSPIDMLNNKITNVGNATLSGDAVNLSQLETKYDKTGGTISGQVVVDNNRVYIDRDGGNVYAGPYGDFHGHGTLFVRSKTNSLRKIAMGIDQSNDLYIIQAIEESVGLKPLSLNPSGGSVDIGADTTTNPLRVFPSGEALQLTNSSHSYVGFRDYTGRYGYIGRPETGSTDFSINVERIGHKLVLAAPNGISMVNDVNVGTQSSPKNLQSWGTITQTDPSNSSQYIQLDTQNDRIFFSNINANLKGSTGYELTIDGFNNMKILQTNATFVSNTVVYNSSTNTTSVIIFGGSVSPGNANPSSITNDNGFTICQRENGQANAGVYLQSWNSRPIVMNSEGNSIHFGKSGTGVNVLHYGGAYSLYQASSTGSYVQLNYNVAYSGANHYTWNGQNQGYNFYVQGYSNYYVGSAWQTISDRRHKEEIEEISEETAIDVVKRLNPVSFKYKTKNSRRHSGFIAQEVDEIQSEFVAKDTENDIMGLDYNSIFTYQAKVIQYLLKEVEYLKSRLVS